MWGGERAQMTRAPLLHFEFPPCPAVHFTPGFMCWIPAGVFNVVAKLAQCRGCAPGHPQLAGCFGQGDCSEWSNNCSAERCLGQQLEVMNDRRFLSCSGQSDPSLLMVSLGKPPGDEQEDHANTFSPGMARAYPVLLHQRIWRSLQIFN